MFGTEAKNDYSKYGIWTGNYSKYGIKVKLKKDEKILELKQKTDYSKYGIWTGNVLPVVGA